MPPNQINITTADNPNNVVTVLSDDRVIDIKNGRDVSTINVSQTESATVLVGTLSAQGPKGDTGPQGPPGNPGDADLSTLATTGSNAFIGNQTITGSLIVSGSSTFTNIGPAIFSGSVSSTNGFTGSLLGTATTASYISPIFISASVAAAGFGSGGGDTTGLVTTSSFNSFTSSINGFTQSILNWTGSVVTNNQTESFARTESFNNFTSSINDFTQSILEWTGSAVTNTAFNSFTQSYSTGSFSGSLIGTADTASYYAETDPIYNAEKGKYLTTGSTDTTQTIIGSLIIDQNLTVLGSQSIQYITSSQLNIGTNLITVNTTTPAVRFGGIAVIDSGSTGNGLTGSLLWDSQHNVWIYQNPSGGLYDGGMLLVGPRSYGPGNEVGITPWYAAIGNGSHHMTSSAIWNSGSLIRLERNTEVVGTLNVSAGITGSFDGNLVGTASWADSASNAINSQTASYINADNVFGIVTNASNATNAETASYITANNIIGTIASASNAINAQTASYTPYNQTIGARITTEDTYITAGSKGYRHVAIASRITKIRTIANTIGSIDVNIRRDGTNLGNINLTNQSASLDTTLTGWTTGLNTNDLIEFYVSQSSVYITDITIFIDTQAT